VNKTWLVVIPVFLLYSVGAYCTYNKSVRESSAFLPIYLGIAIFVGLLWVFATRQFNSTAELLFLSLIWDILMILAYYAGPILFKGEHFGWQAYAAAAMTVSGIFWFKIATSD